MKPEHAALMSKAAMPVRPSRRWMRQAVDGSLVSALHVATMIASGTGVPPACSASAAARAPIDEAVSPGSTRWRSLIPVRSMIHVSEVSTIASMSALVRTPAGRDEPSDRIWATRAAGPPGAAASIVAGGSGAVGIVRLQACPSPRRYGDPGLRRAAAALY